MKKLLFIIPGAIAIIIIALSLYLQPNDFLGCGMQPNGQGNCKKADAIVAISGGDTNARADAAITLFQNGWANTLIFSGAAQDKTGPSNAAAMKLRAISEGVPADDIQLDEDAATTEQNASNTQSIFQRDNIHTVILVTSGYHQRRASLEFNKLTDGVTVLNHPTDDSDWSVWWWLTPRGWWLAGGEVVKIAVFYARGVTGW